MAGTLQVDCEGPEERVDVYLARLRPDISRSQVQRWIRQGLVRLNGSTVKPSNRLKAGDCLSITIPEPADTKPQPEAIPVEVVYQDTDVVVVNKPPGLTVHPAPGHPQGTLVNALLARYPELGNVGDPLRPGLVHRLDADTSGLMVVARTPAARLHLARQIQERTVRKVYLALVVGHPEPPEGVVEAPIGRDPRNRKRMAIVPAGRPATTRYRTLRRFPGYALLEVTLHTGRTHQIRVHLSSLGFPVAGDRVYGKKVPFLARQFLHAHRLGFRLPSTGKYVELVSPLPADLQEALSALERGSQDYGCLPGGSQRALRQAHSLTPV